MDIINIPKALESANRFKIFPFDINLADTTYLIEIPSIIATRRKHTLFFYWQEQLFTILMRHSTLDIEFYKLPYDRTLSIGSYCEM